MKLKPLEWYEVQPGVWRCDTGFGRYLVDVYRWWGPNSASGRACDSIDHGKSLCQDDYERRVGELFESEEVEAGEMPGLVTVPGGMCPAFYEFMGAGAPRGDDGSIKMLATQCNDRVARNVESPVDFDAAVALLDRVTDLLQSTDADRRDAEMFRWLVKRLEFVRVNSLDPHWRLRVKPSHFVVGSTKPQTIRAAIEAAMKGGE